jgi:chromosome segregation ATPase
VKLLERNLPEPSEIEEYNQRIEEMDKIKFEAAKNINGLEQESESLESQVSKLTQQLEQLQLRKTAIDQEAAIELPAIKYALSIYSTISNIRWDYENPKVKGCKILDGGCVIFT